MTYEKNGHPQTEKKKAWKPPLQRRRRLPGGRWEIFVHPDLQGGRSRAVPQIEDSPTEKPKSRKKQDPSG